MDIIVVVEGQTDEALVQRILARYPNLQANYQGKGGIAHIEQRIEKYNQLARIFPVLCLVDLDRYECAPVRIQALISQHQHAHLYIRVAVKQIEAWLLADQENLAKFIGVPINRIPQRPDEIDNPKLVVVDIARHSHKKDIQRDMIPVQGSSGRVGGAYTTQLIRFITNHWDIDQAAEHSPSLARMLKAIQRISELG
jgi:5S rRNA maturation endonuclease (ribonuclease M5)